ncbi:class I SAM-dependent methyltransferase [Anatilimnocola floriformis]|uniref:class I SAM-dependent methyltransferase n=1 Tax=Anatilimnocola floriformis TaxID=2948575 RepID=UPI0020C284FC|nr:class I SAM-dependent methyltransferase [Anatilimnocola floriformis]
MDDQQLKHLFDQQAAGYDARWAKLAPIRESLHLLLESLFAELPARARVLCVGVGTGAELEHLARAFPGWDFMALDLSGAMLEACRRRAEAGGFLARCSFHEGTVDSLPDAEAYDGATCFLVSQFILDPSARTAFFRSIARRLRSGGMLVNTELSAATETKQFEELLRPWVRMMATTPEVSPATIEKMREAYRQDVAILPAAAIESIIELGWFSAPVQFYQAGLIRGWFSRSR